MSGRDEESDFVIQQPSLDGNSFLSNKPWVSLSRFEVRCQGRDKVRCPVYANSRQRVPIEITIEARDEDGVVVDVNHAELRLRICGYEDPEDYDYLNGTGTDAVEDVRYVYNWQVSNAVDGGEDAGHMPASVANELPSQVFKRWVRVFDGNIKTFKFAACCTSPSGILFATNTPNPSPGKFDSWLLIDGREPKVHRWDCFGLSGPHNTTSSGNFDVDLYYIYFTDPNYRIVNSINRRQLNERGAHYAWNKSDWRMEQFAYQRGDRRQVTHHSCFNEGYNITFTIDDKPGQATAARIRDGMGRMCQNYSYQHGLVGYIDQFGNESRVMLRASSNGNTMSLDNPARADEVEPPSDEEST